MSEKSWSRAAVRSVLIALGVGAGVAVVAAVIATNIASRDCTDDYECLAVVTGIGAGVAVGGIAAAVTVLVLAVRLGAGPIFGIGAAATILLLVRAAWGAFLGQAPLLVFLAAIVGVAGTLVGSSYRRAEGDRWRIPLRTVVVAAGVLVIATLPVASKLVAVWSEQRKIEAVVERPLQTDLDGTWPYSVSYSSTGVDYAVLERPTAHGDRIADIDVTTRTLDPDQAPCTGFEDKTEGPVTECTALAPNLWQARGDQGEARYFVHAGDRQWAYVRSGTYGGADAQRMHDARAEQVARSLQPRSAWPLAADSAACGFCEWLT
ncbi:hypothetical protein OG558_20390 [Kribbella sp. NBC_01510]|uniref:hypothetical protein n=1 Tax=Kribbella sp. NBC_01510 TaxID=2903581 RepID=UPI003868F8EB